MNRTYGLGALVGIGGAGSAGRALAADYVGEFARRGSSHGLVASLSPRGELFDQPPVLVVIWLAADMGAPWDLRVWSRRQDKLHGDIVLGICIGGAPERSWSHPVVCVPDGRGGGRVLGAVLDCVAEQLVGRNLVNLRIHEFRSVLRAGVEWAFTAGWADEGAGVQVGLRRALSDPALDGRLAIRGLWVHVSGVSVPSVGDVAGVHDFLRTRLDPSDLVWVGATGIPSLTGGVRVSLLATLASAPEPEQQPVAYTPNWRPASR